ncbi:hypothetical protein [Streptomyces triculaminicus]|uniref:hypothetical protein n=1 Tax=Streptomyces triculaminicus TaxID=2816232 RepID=UPI0037CEE7A6
MSADFPNPFGGYRWAVVDPDQELLAQLPVADLVQGAVNGTVEEAADARYGHRLFAELDRRGDGAWWQAAVICLDFLARNPVNGLEGVAAAAELRRAARSASTPAARLGLEVLAEHRAGGAAAAAVVWEGALPAQRAEAGRKLFVITCASARSGSAVLAPPQVIELNQKLVG